MNLSQNFLQKVNQNFLLGVDYPGQGLVNRKEIVDNNMIKVGFVGRKEMVYFELCSTNNFFLEV